MTIEIPPKNWKQFCDILNERHRGAVMDIRLHSKGNLQVVAQDVSLQAMTFDDKSDACNNFIEIDFGLQDEKPTQHFIIDPTRVILRKQNDSDRYNLMELLAENGTTVIVFHPGIGPSILNILEMRKAA